MNGAKHRFAGARQVRLNRRAQTSRLRMCPPAAITKRQLRGRLRMALPRARAIQRLHPAPSAREHKAQRSCTVRQAVRRLAAARPSPMYLPMHTTLMRQHGQSRRASPAVSETVCLVRITTAREHRSLRSCTECTAANKQINRWKAAAGGIPLPPSVYRFFCRHLTLCSELHSRTNRCDKSRKSGENVIFSVKLRQCVIISSFFVKPC